MKERKGYATTRKKVHVLEGNPKKKISDPLLGRQCEGGQGSNAGRQVDDQNYQKMLAYKIAPIVSRWPRHARDLPMTSANLSLKGTQATMKEVRETSQCNEASRGVQGKQALGSSSGKVPHTSRVHHPGRACEFESQLQYWSRYQ